MALINGVPSFSVDAGRELEYYFMDSYSIKYLDCYFYRQEKICLHCSEKKTKMAEKLGLV